MLPSKQTLYLLFVIYLGLQFLIGVVWYHYRTQRLLRQMYTVSHGPNRLNHTTLKSVLRVIHNQSIDKLLLRRFVVIVILAITVILGWTISFTLGLAYTGIGVVLASLYYTGTENHLQAYFTAREIMRNHKNSIS